MGDEVRLSQEVQELTTSIGYSVSSGRTKTYLGVRHRRTNLTIEDELGYIDPLGEIETKLASRTELKSEATLAVAGVESRVNDRLYGQVETAVGEGDLVVQANIRYLWPPSPPPSSNGEKEEMRRRATEIAKGIAGPLRELEASLERWRVCLEQRTCSAEEFVDHTESALLGILSANELAGLRAWVLEEFRKVRRAEGLPVADPAFASASHAWRGDIRRAAHARAATASIFVLVLAIVTRPRELGGDRRSPDRSLLMELSVSR